MLNRWQMQVFGGIVFIFVFLDMALLVRHSFGLRDGVSEFLPWIVFPAQATLLAIWMAWPWATRSSHTVPLPEVRFVLGAKALDWLGIKTPFPTNVARFGLGAAGVILVVCCFMDSVSYRPPLPIVSAMFGSQLAIVFTLLLTVPPLIRRLQFRLWHMLAVITVVAITAGLLRGLFLNDSPGAPDLQFIVVASFHSIHALAILAALSARGRRRVLLGLLLALVIIALLVFLQFGVLSLLISQGAYRGLVILVLTAISLLQTGVVFVALVLLRLCGLFGGARRERQQAREPEQPATGEGTA